MTEERHELPIIAELRQAIMGIRPAIDQALEVGAPMNTCAACERAFYFLGPVGFEAAPEERCPRCATAEASRRGISLEAEHVERLLTARRGLLAVASEMVLAREAKTLDQAIELLEELEQHPKWLETLALARAVTGDPRLAHRATMLVVRETLPVAATHDRIAAAMARWAVVIRPDSVVRIVVKLRGKVLHDGPLALGTGTKIRELEAKHGRKLHVTCYQKDGKVVHKRGEKRDPPDEPQVEGVRHFMARATALLVGKG